MFVTFSPGVIPWIFESFLPFILYWFGYDFLLEMCFKEIKIACFFVCFEIWNILFNWILNENNKALKFLKCFVSLQFCLDYKGIVHFIQMGSFYICQSSIAIETIQSKSEQQIKEHLTMFVERGRVSLNGLFLTRLYFCVFEDQRSLFTYVIPM
jgi:hypothetical protein